MLIRKAYYEDLNEICKIMDEVENPWFYKDDREYVYNHIDKNGFILLAEEESILAYLMIHFVDYDEDVGLCHIAYIDSVGVLSKARGKSLMKKLIIKAEHILRNQGYCYFMATVHPDNIYSLRVLESLSYCKIKAVFCYPDLKRFLLLKNEEITLR